MLQQRTPTSEEWGKSDGNAMRWKWDKGYSRTLDEDRFRMNDDGDDAADAADDDDDDEEEEDHDKQEEEHVQFWQFQAASASDESLIHTIKVTH